MAESNATESNATEINATEINATEINAPEINDAIQQTQEPQLPPIALPPIATKDMDVTFVQDVSGSMEDQRVPVVKGINEIIVDLQKRYREPCEYRAHIRIIKFSSHDNIRVGERVPVHDVPLMDPTELLCDGMTALWDAVGIAIGQMNTSSAGVPATTYVFTDGDNNDSKTHTQSGVNEMTSDNKKRNPMHSILFIGSDPSAKRNAVGMGLDRVHSIQHDSDNTPVAYEVCRRALGRCISGDTQSTEFNNEDIVMSETPSHHAHHAHPAHHDEYDRHVDPVGDSQLTDDFAFVSDDVPTAAPRRAASGGGMW
jgi:uncharacterized protein YegL